MPDVSRSQGTIAIEESDASPSPGTASHPSRDSEEPIDLERDSNSDRQLLRSPRQWTARTQTRAGPPEVDSPSCFVHGPASHLSTYSPGSVRSGTIPPNPRASSTPGLDVASLNATADPAVPPFRDLLPDDQYSEFTINSPSSSESNPGSSSPRHTHSRYSRYLPSPLRLPSPSNLLSAPPIDLTSSRPVHMRLQPVEPPWPPTHEATAQPERWVRPYHPPIDLTREPSLSDMPRMQPRRRTLDQSNPSDEPSRKRAKTSKTPDDRSGGACGSGEPGVNRKIEEVDLLDEEDALAAALKKQREDQVKAQRESAGNPPNLSNLTCVICMDSPTDLTATSCGHLFCHACLMEALIAGENRPHPGQHMRSQCPVCRKNISRNKKGDTIPLELMKKGLATQPKAQRSPSTLPT